MKIVLKKEKVIPFDFDGLKGEFVCESPKASEHVSFWAGYRAIEGTEEIKAEKQAEMVTSKFLNSIKEINFTEETTFEEDGTDKLMDPKTALAEYYSIPIYHIGLKYLTPNFGGSEKDPLGVNSKG